MITEGCWVHKRLINKFEWWGVILGYELELKFPFFYALNEISKIDIEKNTYKMFKYEFSWWFVQYGEWGLF